MGLTPCRAPAAEHAGRFLGPRGVDPLVTIGHGTSPRTDSGLQPSFLTAVLSEWRGNN